MSGLEIVIVNVICLKLAPNDFQELGSCDAVVAGNYCDGSTTTVTVSQQVPEPTQLMKSVEIKPAGQVTYMYAW